MKKFKTVICFALAFLLVLGISAPVKNVKALGITLTPDQCPTAAEGLVYNGSSQALLNAPKEALPQPYTDIAYAMGNETEKTGDWYYGIPEAVDAGTYYVWWIALGDEESTEPAMIEVTIAEAPDPGPGPEPEPEDKAVKAVIELINNIGTLEYTEECYDRYQKAKAAYDALTPEQQEKVTNYAVLEEAEQYFGSSEDYEDEDSWIDPILLDMWLAEDLAKVTGEHQVVHLKGDFALQIGILSELEYSPTISLEYTVTYDGKEYTIMIPGGYELVDDNIIWYGPLYLISHFGNGAKLKKIEDDNYSPEDDSYIVQEGDTLTSLAAKFDTTVDELASLNGITNPNMLFAGQKVSH